MDMPILDDDFVRDEPEENEDQIDIDVPPQDTFDRLISERQSSSNAQSSSTPLPVKTSAPEQKLGSYGSTLTEEQRKRMEYNKILATERRKAKFLNTQSPAILSNENNDLFIMEESASANQSSTNDEGTYSRSEDIFAQSSSLLSQKSEKLHPISSDCSEELELDDLVDLVDVDDEEPSIISSTANRKDNISSNTNAEDNSQLKFIDLCDEIDSEDNDKICTETVDLVTRNIMQNKVIEVINLESKNNSSEPIVTVDLSEEIQINVNSFKPVINLENEVIDFANKIVADNPDAGLVTTPISSSNPNSDNFEMTTLNKASESLHDNSESMEVD